MIKSVMYYLLLLTTSVRLVDLIYLLITGSNLPVVVLAVTSVMILFGIGVLVRRLVGAVRLRLLLTFYLVQTGMILFNIAYVALTWPLQLTGLETLIVGSFLDVLINISLVYLAIKQSRGRSFVMVGDAQ